MAKKNEPKLSSIEQKMVDILTSNGPCHIKKLAAELDKSSAGIVDLAQSLRDKDIFVVKSDDVFYLGNADVRLPPEAMVIKDFEVKVGLIADTMLGSKSEQPTNLCRAFQIAEHRGVDLMIHAGVSAGKPTKMKLDEYHKKTIGEQIDYIVRNYPSSKNFKTRLISGYHDMQWRKDGRNILAEVCMQREDLVYRGDWQSDFPLRRGPEKGDRWPLLKMAYHGGDDTPYSKSYPVQGFAENLVQDVKDLYTEDHPDIVAVAGQGIFCDLSGGIIPHLVSVPGLRLISSSMMRKKRRSVVPTVGLVILTIKFDKEGNFSVSKAVYPLLSVKDDYREKYSDDKSALEGLSKNARAVLKLLEKSPKTLGELTQAMDRSDYSIKSLIEELKRFGCVITEPSDEDNPSKNYKLHCDSRLRFTAPKLDLKKYFATTIRRGGVSDTHIGHNSELLEIEHEAYDLFLKRGIDTVFHCGDITNGPPKHEEHNKGEVRESRATPLTNDVITLYPKRKGISTLMISGDHDRWFLDKSGYDILDPISRVREDIKYMGVQQGEHIDGRIITWLRHFNWGTGYAKSYKPQQVAEGLLKEIEKEAARYRGRVFSLLSGGGHVYCAMLYKGIIFILMPCLQGKTGFITGLGKLSDVGFVIYSITHSDSGQLTEFAIEYFDRGAEALDLIRKRVDLRKSNLELALEKIKK
jgi:predicted phosphodiesterase/biotin operon repressor